jgi:hypothetical protein
MGMRDETPGSIACMLESATSCLRSLMRASETEIGSLTQAFEALAAQARTVLSLASAIIECIEDEGVVSALPKVQSLGAAAAGFVEARLQATHGILDSVAIEMKLLRRLSGVTKSQSVIALKTRVLTMMTNIEVGRLGDSGEAFQHLATELAKFSAWLTEGTDELELHTEARRLALDATKRVLASELPQLAEEFARIDVDLGDDLKALETGLMELFAMPTQFKTCVKEIAEQIARVIAAVQSYDITRQQLEHVEEALARMRSGMRDGGDKRWDARERSRTYAGITVQIYQLQHIRGTVANWTSQIGACMEVILKVSASELTGMGPMVFKQEREICAKLGHVELLESQSEGYSERIRRTVGEHASLVQLIDHQVKNAGVVRQLLHLLSLNSIVEASRLGARANPILELGNGISELSMEWCRITGQSEDARQEMMTLVEQIGHLMETFSEAGDERLRDAQIETRSGLRSLHAAAEFAARQASDIQLALGQMQAMGVGVARSGDVLDAAYGQIEGILSSLQSAQRQLQDSHSGTVDGRDVTEMEQLYSASYTTEVEREVLHAALSGTALPVAQAALAGNGVELF